MSFHSDKFKVHNNPLGLHASTPGTRAAEEEMMIDAIAMNTHRSSNANLVLGVLLVGGAWFLLQWALEWHTETIRPNFIWIAPLAGLILGLRVCRARRPNLALVIVMILLYGPDWYNIFKLNPQLYITGAVSIGSMIAAGMIVYALLRDKSRLALGAALLIPAGQIAVLVSRGSLTHTILYQGTALMTLGVFLATAHVMIRRRGGARSPQARAALVIGWGTMLGVSGANYAMRLLF